MNKLIAAALLASLSLVWAGLARADDAPSAPPAQHLAPTVHHAAHGHLMPLLVQCHAQPLDAGTAGSTVQVCVAVAQ